MDKNKYGYFDDSLKEYIITNPHTPVKWINYIGTLGFGGIIDHTGGALLCKKDPALNRISKYTPQYPDGDFKGTTAYIRVHKGEGYEIYSPYYVPTLKTYDKYECHVGLSYQKFIHIKDNLKVSVTVFVPPGECVEIRDYVIENTGKESLDLDLVPVVEYSHPSGLMQYTNADWCPQTMTSEVLKEGDQTILLQYPWMNKGKDYNFFTSNAAASSFETIRSQFLGNNEYSTWADPASLYETELKNGEARRGDNIAALLLSVKGLKTGQKKRIITFLGQADPENMKAAVRKYSDEANVDRAFADLKTFWKKHLSALQVNTPDESFNTMVNVHNPRQCHTTFNWSRYLSCYQLGLGARGLGMRDSSQDVLGILAQMPEQGRELIEKLISVQRPEGCAMHQFFPLTMEANMGDGRESDKDFYGDDHLWFILAVSAYVKETGDYDFLEKSITFYEEDKPEADRESGSVLEHIKRALNFSKINTGAHGLPLLGFADWNDSVNLPGAAESMHVANLYGWALKETIELCEYLDNGLAAGFRQDYEGMKKSYNACAWDGKWFIRYFKEDKTPVGSSQNDKGKIYLNAQTWPVMSGFAEEEQAKTALDSANELLNTDYGIKISHPGYTEYDPNVGGVTTYPPGAKENGGIFLHTNPWAMIAETKLGNGDRAYQYYQQINPAFRNDHIDQYECEPYCYAQNILSDEHPQEGLARNSWLSGTSSWTYQAATQYITGIRATHRGLQVDPCIPGSWDKVVVDRKFRGSNYHITILNPGKLSRGIKRLELDGKAVEGNIIPLPDKPGDFKISCTIEK